MRKSNLVKRTTNIQLKQWLIFFRYCSYCCFSLFLFRQHCHRRMPMLKSMSLIGRNWNPLMQHRSRDSNHIFLKQFSDWWNCCFFINLNNNLFKGSFYNSKCCFRRDVEEVWLALARFAFALWREANAHCRLDSGRGEEENTTVSSIAAATAFELFLEFRLGWRQRTSWHTAFGTSRRFVFGVLCITNPRIKTMAHWI